MIRQHQRTLICKQKSSQCHFIEEYKLMTYMHSY